LIYTGITNAFNKITLMVAVASGAALPPPATPLIVTTGTNEVWFIKRSLHANPLGESDVGSLISLGNISTITVCEF
jgi:hypothetical protein